MVCTGGQGVRERVEGAAYQETTLVQGETLPPPSGGGGSQIYAAADGQVASLRL